MSTNNWTKILRLSWLWIHIVCTLHDAFIFFQHDRRWKRYFICLTWKKWLLWHNKYPISSIQSVQNTHDFILQYWWYYSEVVWLYVYFRCWSILHTNNSRVRLLFLCVLQTPCCTIESTYCRYGIIWYAVVGFRIERKHSNRSAVYVCI